MNVLEEYLLIVDEPKYINAFYEMKQRALDYFLVIEQFQKLLGVYTTTEALAKIAVLMREDDTASKLLSKALGHLHSCTEDGSRVLYNEIASAFGEAVEQMRAADKCPALISGGHEFRIKNNFDVCIHCGTRR